MSGFLRRATGTLLLLLFLPACSWLPMPYTVEQIDGINDRHLCWGLEISGDDVTAQQIGRATLEYNVEDLRRVTRVSVI